MRRSHGAFVYTRKWKEGKDIEIHDRQFSGNAVAVQNSESDMGWLIRKRRIRGRRRNPTAEPCKRGGNLRELFQRDDEWKKEE